MRDQKLHKPHYVKRTEVTAKSKTAPNHPGGASTSKPLVKTSPPPPRILPRRAPLGGDAPQDVDSRHRDFSTEIIILFDKKACIEVAGTV